MDSQSATAESKPRHRQSNPWSKASSTASTPRVSPAAQLESPPAHFATPLDLIPILSQQSSLYQAQLLQYNKLISPGRGGGGGGLQTSPHALATSPTHFQTTTRSRSSSKVSNKDNSSSRPGTQNCHGNKPAKTSPESADRASMTPPEKELPQPKMAGKKAADRNPQPANQQTASQLPARPPPTTRSAPPVAAADHPGLSNSVPSTPHQRARQFSFGSRDPSPGAPHNHSPRSAYSETNSTLPSLRPLPPRMGGCRFETMPAYGRRRMNYSIGDEKLERVDLDKIKSRLSEDDERKLSTDMRELYNRLQPTDAIGKNRHKLVQKLEKLFNDEWPGHDIRVHLFGSSGNLLCSDDSDVDICITTEWTELEGVCMIADLLARHGMEKVVCVSQAKVPIVKIWDPELGLACDMNVNNTVALENTRMVRTYVQIDERVRPLAMIIKYWTRRRIVNDAAFGGTLSSYTWICMIIAFLQLRNPPVLPALHQRHEEKLTDQQGRKSDFADDIDKLRGFGDRNTDSLGALLFQFFRFYAHEFDYDKYALSVRLGRLITKSEKKWHLAQNNRLCVEEPFNTTRNLGNTADDYSFRGLHLELRRAFDLIAEGKLDECCEQYEFPEEEPRTIFQKPAAVPRPILVRSASQHNSTSTRGGRGGYRGGGGRQFHRNGGNNSRRASSVASYDTTNTSFAQAGTQSQLTPQEAQLLWYQAQQPQLAMHQDIFGTTMNALQAQENSLRFHLYTQQQALQTQQALAVAQRMQSGGSTQSTDRSRTNSFDNPPLTAPIRPDMQYIYPYPMQPSPYYGHPGFTTYPSSPSTTASGTAPEFRRSLHRSTITSESGLSTGSGSLRSQSQPASRTSLPPGAQGTPGYPTAAQGPTSVPSFPLRQLNGVVPSFIPDERLVPDYSNDPNKPLSNSPPEDDGPRYVGFYVNEAPAPIPNPASSIHSVNGVSNGVTSLGDASLSTQGRRRLSTDQIPQSILDRRMRRTSRSPSPGHTRAFSVGGNSAPLASGPFPQTASKLGPSRPLVVNGTAMPVKSAPVTAIPNRQTSGTGSLASDDMSYDNPLRISQQYGLGMSWPDQFFGLPPQSFGDHSPPDLSGMANGTAAATPTSAAVQQPLMDSPSFNQRMAQFSTLNINAAPYTYMNGDSSNGLSRQAQSGRARVISRQQQNGIAPLDLATGDFMVNQDLQHLSPVYEHRTPSPTFMRKYETPLGRVEKAAGPVASKLATARDPSGSLPPKPPTTQKSHLSKTPPLKELSTSSPTTNSRTNGFARENGHGYGVRKEGEHASGWQKQKNKKKAGVADLKTAAAAAGFTQVEQLPKNDAERKGG